MSVVTESKTARKWAMPDTLVIIFFVAILTSIATWVVPVGMFDSQEVQYQVDGQTKTRKVVDPHSFRIVTNEAGEEQYHRVQFFTTGDERPGLMNFPFEGLTSGSKFGTAVGIIMFMLVIGGAFGIVMRTGTVDNGILALIRHTRGNEVLFIPVLFVLFSLGGAVFGMGEEAVAFAIIIAPLMVRLGYDSITTVLVTYIATQIGFASSWMNPFCVVVAQGIAGVPVLSGSGLRIVVWIVATLIGLVFTLVYASRVKKNPLLSRVHESDRYFREQQDEVVQRPFTFGDWLVGRLGRDCPRLVYSGDRQPVFHHGRGDRPHRRYLPPQRYDGQRDGVLIHRRGEDDDRARLAGGFCQRHSAAGRQRRSRGTQRAQYVA